ncbi:MAG: hypothetical protein Q7Q71_04170 [Verrucomicrobiota bacterium JB023]|nr:hypothetical protein [Verrucomicrobiota bacterium JB023]
MKSKLDISPSPKGGFSLVATVTLMVLLAMIAIGLLSLSAVTVRSSGHGILHQEARANARLSLQLAIAELQRLTGPDQRVTANASILSENEDTPSTNHITGVWKSWAWDLDDEPQNYEERKEEDFLGWLTSQPERTSGEAPVLDLPYLPEDAVTLVGRGTVPAEKDEVRAARIELGEGEGSIAWTVLDQGQKASVLLDNELESDVLSDRLAALTAPAEPGYRSVRSEGRNWNALANDSERRMKYISTRQLEIGGLEPDSPYFHDLAPLHLGLPIDVVQGGFAKDLSLLLEKETLPIDYQRRFLYSEAQQPLANPPNRFSGANVMPAPDPLWSILHSHYRLYKEVQDPATRPVIDVAVDERPAAGLPPARTMFSTAFSQQQIAPVIANAQFIFSLGFGKSPIQAKGGQQPGQNDGEDWVAWLITDPVITLWNPYNVNLRFEEAQIDLYRVPLAFQIFRNGQTFGAPTLFSNSYLPGDFATAKGKYYRLNMKPPLDEDGNEEDEVIMKPGEHLVFTAHNHIPHYLGAYYKTGADLRPGWHAPAGTNSDPNVGGFSSLNLLVNSTGNDSGTINGATSRVIPVKSGDAIQIAVSTQREGRNTVSEAGNKEVTFYAEYFVKNSSSGSTPLYAGAIEVDYADDETSLLESYEKRDLPTIIVPRNLSTRQGDSMNPPPAPACSTKEPFLITSTHLKTTNDSREPSRGWLHNAPTNLYASAGLDQSEDETHHQYEFKWEPMTDWNSTPTVEIDPVDRGYGASGIYAQTGREIAPFAGVPLAPLLSLAQLRHAPLNAGGQLPLQSQIVGNSFSCPLIPPAEFRTQPDNRTFLDHSFLANQTLFDSYFFSGITDQIGTTNGRARDAVSVFQDFLAGEEGLPNQRFTPLFPDNAGDLNAVDLVTQDEGYLDIAAHLGIKGAFNINSTSVAAWEALIASLQPDTPSNILTETGDLSETYGEGMLGTRFIPPLDEQLDGTTDPLQHDQLIWQGHRRLDDYQVTALAEAIVEEVRARGPFQSVAEFVNRRLEDSELGLSGALQAAIDKSGLNEDATAFALEIINDGLVSSPNPEASEGTTMDGAPCVLNQADLLTPLAPFITARSDTFIIRAYGEARRGGNIARAWCQATVQRTPDFLDSSMAATADSEELKSSLPNSTFGRRYKTTAFQWLSEDEV